MGGVVVVRGSVVVVSACVVVGSDVVVPPVVVGVSAVAPEHEATTNASAATVRGIDDLDIAERVWLESGYPYNRAMPLVVQKYGGTSVADADRIRNVARRIVDTHTAGNDVVAVVSAMGKGTDELLALAHEVLETAYPREQPGPR